MAQKTPSRILGENFFLERAKGHLSPHPCHFLAGHQQYSVSAIVPQVRTNRTQTQTCFLLGTQVSKANEWIQTGRFQLGIPGRKNHLLPFLPYLIIVLIVTTVQVQSRAEQEPEIVFFSYLKTTFLSYQLSQGLPPPPSARQGNLSSDRISFFIVISFYGPASPSRCKIRNVNSKESKMICKSYAGTSRHQLLCVLTNIKLQGFRKINVFLTRSHDNGELSAVCHGL